MSGDNFIYLNVPGLLGRYSNPSSSWRDIVIALATTQVRFFENEGLLRPDQVPSTSSIETCVLRFHDFTSEGQAFLKSGAVERWLGACDRIGTVDAYKSDKGLRTRLLRFRETR